MSLGLVGRKVGMTRVFTEDGDTIPVTVVDVSNNRVTQVKTAETDGYAAVQVAYGRRRASRVNKAAAGHFAKAGVEAGHTLREFRVKPEKRMEFEAHYGSDGTWAVFFRKGRGYKETILLRDREAPGRYLTIDVWTDVESYRSFSATHAREYKEIDRRCEEFTEEERCLGNFDAL